MEEPKFDLPTLHRPAAEEMARFGGGSAKLSHPIPAPPHRYRHNARFSAAEASSFHPSRLESVPQILSDKNWQVYRAKQSQVPIPTSSEFNESYSELVTKKAYRYPHPGVMRGREGRAGSSWRHMKEAIGYGPGRLMWVDGVITLYDMPQSLNEERPWSREKFTSANVHPARSNFQTSYSASYRPSSSELTRGFAGMNTTGRRRQWYSSNMPQPLPFAVNPPGEMKQQGKYKGFYSSAQTYS